MIKKQFLIFVILLFAIPVLIAQKAINLSGEWQVKLDKNNELVQKYPGKCKTEGFIQLPASLAEKGFGYKTDESDFGILTPAYKYVGKAWYTKQIEIPKQWKNKKLEIVLERVLWESRVIIDGKELSCQDALGTPHIHQLGTLEPGKHQLTILVDNEMIHNIGDKGHAYGEYTQSIWNGIVGNMTLTAYDDMRITSVKTYPHIDKELLDVKISIQSEANTKLNLAYEIVSLASGDVVLKGQSIYQAEEQDPSITIPVQTKGQLKKWSEFSPEVYVLRLFAKAGNNKASYETEFGFYQVSHDGTKVLVNGQPVFLRGNLDCVHFPITGYVSCSLEDWERIFRIYKQYGLNHARFHSWCPPEAAFKAANRIGIYLQAEASIWIDWWMSEDMVIKGRPEMDTKGHPKGLGYDAKRDKFVVAEMNRVVETYGNHPSFTMFCIGNELGNSDFEVMKTWVEDLKKKDSRRLYAVSTARKITAVDDYCATHYIQDVGRTRGLSGPHTDWDFEETYSKMNIPIIAHEIGQWPVYPKWTETDKYTGVLKARNFEEFKVQAQKNGVADQDEDFAKASGALNQVMYKYETESFFRTASCAGVQLLSMQDYQGQGEALIGWLDAHWDSKGITTPEKFREHYNTTVPLLRMKKFVWTSDETYAARALLSHHGAKSLMAESTWDIRNKAGQVISKGTFGIHKSAVGSLNELGEIKFNLNTIKKAEKLTVSIDVKGTKFRNQWDIWVYPGSVDKVETGEILLTEHLDEQTKKILENGGKVLLVAHQLGHEETSVKAHFYPLYWSLTFFPGQGKTCIGLLLKDQHPAFADFPTSYYGDWQWETISKDAKGFILNDMPQSYKPIAQPVDDFHRNNKIGSVFEVAVGKGKLLVCGYNLNAELPVARQLKASLLKYVASPEFNPQQQVNYSWLEERFPYIPTIEKADVPDGFKGAVLFVEAAAKLVDKEKNTAWSQGVDKIIIADKTTYKVSSDGVWKDNKGTAWHGKNMTLQINCPDGILGSLYVHFHDWNKAGRKGLLEFEGRKVKLDKHDGEGQWVKFHVMREDSNDGKLILKTNAQSGSNLMITKVILVKE